MEDGEDDSQIDDDKCEDMELEDDTENMVDMYLYFAYKKLQNSHYSTGQVYQKQKFNFFKDDLGGDASSGASPASLSDHELISLIQDHPVFHTPLDAHQKG